jgi:pyruvate/2-oxoglutarate dehydrogenase complex dihydrolipoamide dehydrogenase (E3) component
MTADFDVICVGAGPAGEALTAVLHRSGLSLAIIEKHLVGGECPYWGCIPSKTLLRSAETLAEAGRARTLAASHVEWEVDFHKVAARVRYMTRELNDTAPAKALEDQGARLYRGEGRVVGPRTVTVNNEVLTARRALVIATGTSPAMPPIPGLDSVPYWTNREAVQTTELPESLVVIGTGAAGVELAQAFARLGTKIQMIEMMDRVIALEEPEAGHFLGEWLKVEGISIITLAKISAVERTAQGVRVRLQSGQAVEGERLLLAAGRRPNTQGFDLQAAGLKTTARGFIQVDSRTLQAADGIYAVGDINGIGGFTHLSHYHGTLVGRALRGEADAVADHSAVPRVTFTDPEIASVGITAQQADERGVRVLVASANVGQTARGYIHGDPGGVIKLVADAERGILVGATIVSPRAGEMLSELSLAIKLRIPIRTLSDLLHPFPTFSRVLNGMFDELRTKVSPVATRTS